MTHIYEYSNILFLNISLYKFYLSNSLLPLPCFDLYNNVVYQIYKQKVALSICKSMSAKGKDIQISNKIQKKMLNHLL